MDQEFKVGAKAVVPNQGVGVVKEITETDMGDGEKRPYYLIKMLDNGSTHWCAVGMVDENNVREIMPLDLIDELYEILADREKPADKQTWNRRYREYTKKIVTNDPREVAAVLRDLAVLRLGKTLSFGERKMYDRAHGLLVQEIAAVRDVDEQIVADEIAALFKKADEAALKAGKGATKKKKKK